MARAADVDLAAVTDRPCDESPPWFGGYAEAAIVEALHAGHGPQCRTYLAALAYTSAGLEDH